MKMSDYVNGATKQIQVLEAKIEIYQGFIEDMKANYRDVAAGILTEYGSEFDPDVLDNVIDDIYDELNRLEDIILKDLKADLYRVESQLYSD